MEAIINMIKETNKDSCLEIKISILESFIYNLFISLVPLNKIYLFSIIWQKLWNKSCKIFNGTVKTKIHGFDVVLNYGYSYPEYARKFPSYNNPLVELVYQTYQAKERKIVFIDVGAAIGDTILLIYKNCPDMIEKFYCIDGDNQFFEYLKYNLADFSESHLIKCVLSNGENWERELTRTHQGSASAQGQVKVPALSLDVVMEDKFLEKIDLLKIDIDGFDGKALSGSVNLIKKYQPTIIFEWHPILCDRTGNSWLEHFQILSELEYTKYIFFTKYGEFSHFIAEYCCEELSMYAELCIRNKFEYDWHYDVIGLHKDSQIHCLDIAELSFAKDCRSRF